MWPFKRKQKPTQPTATPQQIQFSQVDTTERFGDNLSLAPEDWIETIPLNSMIPNPESMGLPPIGASAEDVYAVASRMSRIRESIQLPNDGVYCPICHIANVNLGNLKKTCPKCGRELLKFGWD